MPERINITNLSKRYGATVALSGVDMDILPGEVHAILGENGAGKSTLVKILSGVVSSNAGTISLDEESIRPSSIIEARRCGIATAFQELSLIPNMTVAENILLPRASSGRFWPESKASIFERAREVLIEWEVDDISSQSIVADLTLAQRQRIELVRALSHARCLLILDEPTAALPDTSWLFRQIHHLTSCGVSVLYISHRLNEVREICQRATVLRNGASMGTVDLAGVDDEDIFTMMVGHGSSKKKVVSQESSTNREVLLETYQLRSKMLKGIDLQLHAGEILGVAGLEGQGQQELFRLFGGLHKPTSGEIRVGDKVTSLNSPRKALQVKPGIAFVPEERKTEGIFASLSAAANISIPHFAMTGWAKLVNGRIERHLAAEAAEQVGLAPRYLGFEVGHLSGGNQQKVLLARALMTGAKILVLFDPTRGVDVGTKQSIYSMMRHFVDQGGAIIFYSSELSELVQLSSRCLVVYDGLITDDVAANEISEERLLASAHGPGNARKDSLQEAV